MILWAYVKDAHSPALKLCEHVLNSSEGRATQLIVCFKTFGLQVERTPHSFLQVLSHFDFRCNLYSSLVWPGLSTKFVWDSSIQFWLDSNNVQAKVEIYGLIFCILLRQLKWRYDKKLESEFSPISDKIEDAYAVKYNCTHYSN